MNMSLLCLVLYCLLTGCGTPDTAGTGIQAEAQGTSGTQKDVDEAQESQEGDTPMPTYTYTTKEQWVQNGDMRIYGVAYIPDTSEKSPLVIFSHELGNDHTSGERYAERLAEAGYATYVFDFCGGTVGGNDRLRDLLHFLDLR
jgi:predicted dienelactone hydrolase